MLETKELEDGEVDRGVKTETALVWSKCRVVLESDFIRIYLFVIVWKVST